MSTKRYNIDSEQLIHMNAKLNYITASQYDLDWSSIVHAHHFTELFFVTGGSGSFILAGNSLPVKKDDLIIVDPYIEHTEISLETNPLRYITLGIEGLSFVNNQAAKTNQSPLSFTSYREDILYYLNALLREVREKQEYFEMACQNLLELLILYLKRKTSYTLAAASNEKIHRECAYIKQYIDSHFTEDITLDILADLAHVNKYYLSHSFKKYLGTSPINYLIDRRIKESKYYLQTTNYSILHISSIIGFSSLSYFSQAFKKNMEMSPNAYRKMKNQKIPIKKNPQQPS